MTLGIIDVGTNSIHLLIGILGLNGKFHVILKERDMTRLGEGGLTKGVLKPAAMRRAIEVLRRYAATMKRCGVDHVEAVATSAVRDAGNGRAFVRAVRARLRVPLRIISGREEARLIYLGVLHTHRFRHAALMVTVGGGSAQVIHGDGLHLRYATSVRLGCARLAQQFIRHDPPTPDELEALAHHVERVWRPVVRAVRRHRWGIVLGSSATIYQVMIAAHVREHGRPPKKKRPLSMTLRSLRQLVTWLSVSTLKDRLQLPGVDPRREDLILPTGMALLAWMEGCGVSTVRNAHGSLREGLVIDYLIRHHQRRTQWFDASLHELFGLNGTGTLSLPARRSARRGRPARTPKARASS